MRAFIFIALFFFSTCLFGQSAFDTKYSKDVCNCLDNFKSTQDLTGINFMDCFQKVMQDDSDLVLQECKRLYGDTSDESGYKFGKDLIERTSISLVRDCRTYFILTDSLRYEDYKNLNQDSLKLQLSNLNNTESSEMNDKLYSSKALLFFQLKMYDSSLIDIEKALNLNSNNFKSLYIKAWINEIKGNYDEAIFLYDKVAELTHMKSFYIFSEVAKRKKKDIHLHL
jgi:tetratricopeptide (TPR) repeat protein